MTAQELLTLVLVGISAMFALTVTLIIIDHGIYLIRQRYSQGRDNTAKIRETIQEK